MTLVWEEELNPSLLDGKLIKLGLCRHSVWWMIVARSWDLQLYGLRHYPNTWLRLPSNWTWVELTQINYASREEAELRLVQLVMQEAAAC